MENAELWCRPAFLLWCRAPALHPLHLYLADTLRKILSGRIKSAFAFTTAPNEPSAQGDMLDLFGLCVT